MDRAGYFTQPLPTEDSVPIEVVGLTRRWSSGSADVRSHCSSPSSCRFDWCPQRHAEALSRVFRVYIRGTNPDAPFLGRHDRAVSQFPAVAVEHVNTGKTLCPRSQVHESHDPAVLLPVHDGEFPEVLVERHEDLAVVGSVRQDLIVTRVGRPIANAFDFVPGGLKVGASPAPHAGIEEDFHELDDSVSAGSIRSCPTKRRA